MLSGPKGIPVASMTFAGAEAVLKKSKDWVNLAFAQFCALCEITTLIFATFAEQLAHALLA